MKKYIKNLKKEFTNLTPEKVIFLIPVFIIILILIPTFFFLTKPLLNETSERKNSIKIMKGKIENIPIFEQTLKNQNEKLKLVNIKREKILSIVVGSKSIETFLSEISDIALRNNISIRKIKKIKPKATVQKKDKPTDPFVFDNSKKLISEISIEGDYNDITRFVKEAENLENLVLFKNFKLSVNRDKNRVLNKLEVLMTVYGELK